jgi:hypothetical protein
MISFPSGNGWNFGNLHHFQVFALVMDYNLLELSCNSWLSEHNLYLNKSNFGMAAIDFNLTVQTQYTVKFIHNRRIVDGKRRLS